MPADSVSSEGPLPWLKEGVFPAMSLWGRKGEESLQSLFDKAIKPLPEDRVPPS